MAPGGESCAQRRRAGGWGAPLRNPPRPTPPRPHVGTGGAATRGRWKPQPCTSSTSLAPGRAALQLHVSPAWKLTPKFGHLCCRGVRGCTASDPSRSSAFHLDAGTCPLRRTAINYFYFYFSPPCVFLLHPGTASSRAFVSAFVPLFPHPPGLNFPKRLQGPRAAGGAPSSTGSQEVPI